MKKIVFCGGGTAGHVMPNIAIIEKLKNTCEIHYIGGNGIEKDIIKKHPYVTYHEIKTTKLVRKFTLKNLLIPFKLIGCVNDAKKVLKEIKPDVIFSKGGFVSVPVVLAHGKIPVYAHESDFTMGLANKLIYPHCKKMFFSFSITAEKYDKKGVYSGTPIRKDIFNGNKQRAKEVLKIKNNLPNILVVGGSSGALAINKVIVNNLNTLTKHYNIIHITGKNKQSKISHKNYFQVDYAENMGDLLDLADIIISRAGSNAIFEFLTLNKQMILIPLPTDQSRGDQILNARYFEKNGWAQVILQQDLNTRTLLNAIEYSKKQKNKTKANTQLPDATKIILNELKQYL